jgi:acyl-CoA reductase-like NAD-dependent aldehyde dehydrogenase
MADEYRMNIAGEWAGSEGGAERVRTGWVNVNQGTNYWESHLPFGGRTGSAIGVGRVGGRSSIEMLTELETIVVRLG